MDGWQLTTNLTKFVVKREANFGVAKAFPTCIIRAVCSINFSGGSSSVPTMQHQLCSFYWERAFGAFVMGYRVHPKKQCQLHNLYF
ncbi:MAG: hypothetical protein RMK18_02815 [Armatimonadota bacterium]|nr:hypothetical protein [Armatimonadota bacterium]MCX7776953.1 hypothetical protein [Armatimonadota bacterium]MDW8024787.1 hypothetical protein [Armatimonadota bacterium]